MADPTALEELEQMSEIGDKEYLKDFSFGAGEQVASKYFNRKRLTASTWPARWLGSICSRSRYHVVQHLPDVVGLTFRTRRPDGTKNDAIGDYRLRFNGAKDLCVIAAAQWERQIHVLRNPDPIISTLHSLRNIGLDLETLVDDRVRRLHKGQSACLCDDPEIPAEVTWLLGDVAGTLRADMQNHLGWPSPCTFGFQLDPFMSFISELPNIESLVFTATTQPLDAFTLREWEQDMTTRQRFKWSHDRALRSLFLQPNEVYGTLEKTREPSDNVPYEPISDGQRAYVMFEMYRTQPEDILPRSLRLINAHYNEYFPYVEIATKIRFRVMRPFEGPGNFDFNKWRRWYRYEIDHDGNVANGASQPRYPWWARDQVWPTGQNVFGDGSTFPEEDYRPPEDLDWEDWVDASDSDESEGSAVDVVMTGANGDMDANFAGNDGSVDGSEEADSDVEMAGTDPDDISLDVSHDIIHAISQDIDEISREISHSIIQAVSYDLDDISQEIIHQTSDGINHQMSHETGDQICHETNHVVDVGSAEYATGGEENDGHRDSLGNPRFDVPCIVHLVDWHPTCG